MLKLCGVLAILIMPMSTYAQTASPTKALDWANGEWAFDPEQATEEQMKSFNCKSNPMSVNINQQGLVYTSTQMGDVTSKAKILFATDTFLKIQYENEERLMDNGKPHVWIMYFVDRDHFVWIREDWIKDGDITGSTQMRIRCQRLEIS